MNNNSLKINLAIACTLLFWASAFVGIRYSLQDYHPGPLALLRYMVASLAMAVFYWRLPQRRIPSFSQMIKLCLLGFLGIGLYNICLNYGEVSISAGEASFIIGLMPAIAVIFSSLYLKEQIAKSTIYGIITSLVGLCLIYFAHPSHSSVSLGLVLVFTATLSGAIYSVYQKPLLQHFHPIEITAIAIWTGTLLLMIYIPGLAHDVQQASWTSTLSIVYMGLFPAAIAYACWSYILAYWPTNKAAMTLYMLPFISSLMGLVLLQEVPPLLSFLGGIVTLIGALLSVWKPKPQSKAMD